MSDEIFNTDTDFELNDEQKKRLGYETGTTVMWSELTRSQQQVLADMGAGRGSGDKVEDDIPMAEAPEQTSTPDVYGREFGVNPEGTWEVGEGRPPEPRPPIYDDEGNEIGRAHTDKSKQSQEDRILKLLNYMHMGQRNRPQRQDLENEAQMIALSLREAGEDIDELDDPQLYTALVNLDKAYRWTIEEGGGSRGDPTKLTYLVHLQGGLEALIAGGKPKPFDGKAALQNNLRNYFKDGGIVESYVLQEWDESAWKPIEGKTQMAKVEDLAAEVIKELGLENDPDGQLRVYLAAYNKVWASEDTGQKALFTMSEKEAIRSDTQTDMGGNALDSWLPYHEQKNLVQEILDDGDDEIIGQLGSFAPDGTYNNSFNSRGATENPSEWAQLAWQNQQDIAQDREAERQAAEAAPGYARWDVIATRLNLTPQQEENMRNMIGADIGFMGANDLQEIPAGIGSANQADFSGALGTPAQYLMESNRVNYYGELPEFLRGGVPAAGAWASHISSDGTMFIEKTRLWDYLISAPQDVVRQLQMMLKTYGFADETVTFVDGVFDQVTWDSLNNVLEGIDATEMPVEEWMEAHRQSYESRLSDKIWERRAERVQDNPPPIKYETQRSSVENAINSSAAKKIVGYDLPDYVIDEAYAEIRGLEDQQYAVEYQRWEDTFTRGGGFIDQLMEAINMTEAYGNWNYTDDIGVDSNVGPFQIGTQWFEPWGHDAGIANPDIWNLEHHRIIAEHRLSLYSEMFGGNVDMIFAAWSAGVGGAQSYDWSSRAQGPAPGVQSIGEYVDKTKGFLRQIQRGETAGPSSYEPTILPIIDPAAIYNSTIKETDEYKAGLIRERMVDFFNMVGGGGATRVGAMSASA